MRDLAVRLAREAGDYAVDRASTTLTEQKGFGTDIVTEVDRECERRIIAGIREHYPEHRVVGEESGHHGPEDSKTLWLVDPLDGTNNYAIGVGLFGVCITAVTAGNPVVAVVHDSVNAQTTTAIAGRGAHSDGLRLEMGDAADLRMATVSWVQGYGVTHADVFRTKAFNLLEKNCKRVLRTWSPEIDYGLLARGRTDAVLAYCNEPWDLLGGLEIAREAGGVVSMSKDREIILVGKKTIVTKLAVLLGLPDPVD